MQNDSGRLGLTITRTVDSGGDRIMAADLLADGWQRLGRTGGAWRRRAAASPEKLENELPATVWSAVWLDG